MTDLKQLWLIDIDPNKMDTVNNTLVMQSGCLKVKQLGHYIESAKNSGGYRKSSNTKIKEIMNDIGTITSDDLKNANSLYRFPRLSLSRDKVKVLQEKFDLKLKRDFHQADYGIVSEKYFDGLFVTRWLAKADVADVLSWAQTYQDCFEEDLFDEIVNDLNKIPADAYIVFESEWFSSYYHDGASNIDRYSKMAEKARNIGRNTQYHYYIESLDQWNDIQANMSKLVWDSNMNDLATEDSEVLTEEMYIQLKTMLGWEKTESGCGWQGTRDKENMNLALSIIANCNIQKSHTYIALLFSFLSDSMKDSSVWNTVNFKSVRKKFDKYIQMNGWNWCHSYNYLIEYLIKDNALTEYAWKEIAQKMYDDVLSSQMGVDSKNHFSISPDSIQLKPELKEKVIPSQEELQYMEDLVDMHTESHRL
jgi:hypothetical protein|tara:strand:+ start:1687 stop:2946 length:1260 start_codon:yes stop_codon:yes gene_type:complete